MFVNSSVTDVVLVTLSSTAVETAIAQGTSRWAMARGQRLNTSIVLAAVHGLSGLFRAVSAVEPSLSRPLPTLSQSLTGHLACLDVKQHESKETAIHVFPRVAYLLRAPPIDKIIITSPPKDNIIITSPPKDNIIITSPPRDNIIITSPPRDNIIITSPPRDNIIITSPPRDNIIITSPPKDNIITTSPPKDNIIITSPPKDNIIITSPPRDNIIITSPPKDNIIITSPPKAPEQGLFNVGCLRCGTLCRSI